MRSPGSSRSWRASSDGSTPPSTRRRRSCSIDAEFARLPAQVEVYRAALALIAGDTDGTIEHANRALDLAEPSDHLRRGSAAALVGLAHWTVGDLESASRRYAESLASLTAAGHVSDVLGCSIAVADIQIAQGRLSDAIRTYEAGLDARRGARRGAGHRRHARRSQRGAAGTQRPRRRTPTPRRQHPARRAGRPPPTRVPLARGDGSPPTGRRRPGRRARPPRRGRARLQHRHLASGATRRRRQGAGPARGRRHRGRAPVGGRARPHRRRRPQLRPRVRAHHPRPRPPRRAHRRSPRPLGR